jgi:hypothetical protein
MSQRASIRSTASPAGAFGWFSYAYAWRFS